MNVLEFIAKLKLGRIEGSEDDYSAYVAPVEDIGDAEVVRSRRNDGDGTRHAVLLDLDLPAVMIPSSTEGHSHLYIDAALTHQQYRKLLDVLVEVGIVQDGYASQLLRFGSTALRLPWVKKRKPEPGPKAITIQPFPTHSDPF